MDKHDLATQKIKSADSAHMGMLPSVQALFWFFQQRLRWLGGQLFIYWVCHNWYT